MLKIFAVGILGYTNEADRLLYTNLSAPYNPVLKK